jgi:hypothetical protein
MKERLCCVNGFSVLGAIEQEKVRAAATPLYRLREARSRLWLAIPPSLMSLPLQNSGWLMFVPIYPYFPFVYLSILLLV